MGLIAHNMKCEIPSLIKLTASEKDSKILNAHFRRMSHAKGKLFIWWGGGGAGGGESGT